MHTPLPFPLSFSKISDYYNCPNKFFETHLYKTINFVATAETENGVKKHKALEIFGKTGKRDDTILTPSDYFLVEKLKGVAGIVGFEGCFGFTSPEFDQVHDLKALWDKQPSGSDYYLKGQYDAFGITGNACSIVDHKTGKIKREMKYKNPIDSDVLNGWLQLQLYAVYIFLRYPQVDKVKGVFNWLKEGCITYKIYTRDKLPELQFLLKMTCAVIEAAYTELLKYKEGKKTVVNIVLPDKFYNPTKLCDWCGYKDKCIKHK